MKLSIVIPSCKEHSAIAPLLAEIETTVTANARQIFSTCQKQSASKNRNHCLNEADGDIVIMMDDDMAGFYKGWEQDLIRPLQDKSIMVVSARLLKPNKEYAAPMAKMTTEPGYFPVDGIITACIAFRATDLRFDEHYVGSGFEDTDFYQQMKLRYPGQKAVVTNECKLIHINEMKNQCGSNWNINESYYRKKWSIK